MSSESEHWRKDAEYFRGRSIPESRSRCRGTYNCNSEKISVSSRSAFQIAQRRHEPQALQHQVLHISQPHTSILLLEQRPIYQLQGAQSFTMRGYSAIQARYRDRLVELSFCDCAEALAADTKRGEIMTLAETEDFG